MVVDRGTRSSLQNYRAGRAPKMRGCWKKHYESKGSQPVGRDGFCDPALLSDGKRHTRCKVDGRSSTRCRLAPQGSVRYRAEVSAPGLVGYHRRSPRDKGAVQASSSIDASSEKLISAMPRASGDRVRQVVVEQASMNRCGSTGSSASEVLYLDSEPNSRVSAEISLLRGCNRAHCCRRR